MEGAHNQLWETWKDEQIQVKVLVFFAKCNTGAQYLVKDIPVLAVHDCLEGRPLLARPCLPINSLLLFPLLSPTMSSLSCPFTTPVLTCPPCTLLELCPCTSSAPPATASKAKSWMAAIKNQPVTKNCWTLPCQPALLLSRLHWPAQQWGKADNAGLWAHWAPAHSLSRPEH